MVVWNSSLLSRQNLEMVLLLKEWAKTFTGKHRMIVLGSNTVATLLYCSLWILGQVVPTYICWLMIFKLFLSENVKSGFFHKGNWHRNWWDSNTASPECKQNWSLCNQVLLTVQWKLDKSGIVREIQGQPGSQVSKVQGQQYFSNRS